MPIAGLPDTIVRAIAPFIIAALPVITHALQGIAQEVAKHLPVWTSGSAPPDDKPPGQPTKPEDTPDEPPDLRPLTIRRPQPPALRSAESLQANPEPPPEGRGTDIPPHPATGAAQTGNNRTSEATGATLDPATLTIKVTGRKLQDRANSYEQAIRDLFGSKGSKPLSVKGVGHPDDVFNETAIEVKYTDDYADSIYNPKSLSRFPHSAVDETIDQVRRYSKAYPNGIKLYTNSQEFATDYNEILKNSGITKFSIIVVPSTQ